MLKRNTFSYIS